MAGSNDVEDDSAAGKPDTKEHASSKNASMRIQAGLDKVEWGLPWLISLLFTLDAIHDTATSLPSAMTHGQTVIRSPRRMIPFHKYLEHSESVERYLCACVGSLRLRNDRLNEKHSFLF